MGISFVRGVVFFGAEEMMKGLYGGMVYDPQSFSLRWDSPRPLLWETLTSINSNITNCDYLRSKSDV